MRAHSDTSPATKLIHTNEAILKIECGAAQYMNRDLCTVQTDKTILQGGGASGQLMCGTCMHTA